MNKTLNYFNPSLLLSLIFANYFFYFFLDTKYFFICFASIILLTFFLILYQNLKFNFYIVLIILTLAIVSLGSPVADWDGRSIWLFNAKRIFYNENLSEYTNYLGSEFSHLDYPILIQTLSASLATIIGKWNEVFPKFSNIIFALPALIVISKNTNNRLNKLILIILILFIYEKTLINGDMDALLGLYTISCAVLLIDFSRRNKVDLNDYFLIFLHFSALPMIKVEGIAILFCLSISYFLTFYDYKKKINNNLILIFLLSLIPVLTWKFFINSQNIISSSHLMISGGDRLFENLLDFKFLLILIKHIILNKQMFISLVIFLIVLSKYISIDKENLNTEINKKFFKKEILFIIASIFFYSSFLLLIFIMSEGSPNNAPEIKYFMAISSSDRLFLPVHSLLIICSIYLNQELNLTGKKNK